jgi:hypothetical protein
MCRRKDLLILSLSGIPVVFKKIPLANPEDLAGKMKAIGKYYK